MDLHRGSRSLCDELVRCNCKGVVNDVNRSMRSIEGEIEAVKIDLTLDMSCVLSDLALSLKEK